MQGFPWVKGPTFSAEWWLAKLNWALRKIFLLHFKEYKLRYAKKHDMLNILKRRL